MLTSRPEHALGAGNENAVPARKKAAGAAAGAGHPTKHAAPVKNVAVAKSTTAVPANKENAAPKVKKPATGIAGKQPSPQRRVTRASAKAATAATTTAAAPAVPVPTATVNPRKRNADKQPKYPDAAAAEPASKKSATSAQQEPVPKKLKSTKGAAGAAVPAPAAVPVHDEPAKAPVASAAPVDVAPAPVAGDAAHDEVPLGELGRQHAFMSDNIFMKLQAESQLSPQSKRLALLDDSMDEPDMDEEDLDDPGMCAEYAQDIMNYLMQREQMFMPDQRYITQHPELRWSMRVILVDWLIEVHQKFKFTPETLFLAVNIMDRFLSRRVVSLGKFQLVGLAALFLAAKTEEVSCPPVTQFTYMADNAFKDDDMLRAEQYILRVLDFDIWAPGPYTFMRRISKVDDYNPQHRNMAKFLAEITLLDHRFLRFPSSLVGAACMWLARKLHDQDGWDALFRYCSGYREEELLPAVEFLVDWMCHQQECDFFYRKYGHKKYIRAMQTAQAWAHDLGMEITATPPFKGPEQAQPQ
ncbi:hypothetical protein AMAG_00674 [Allomyces macrogynus ATCC 38327]|uniref:Uncharacterized protein n=1 Tax=Allomyces macrogynus (strain ATCC 38327) TaxID=578462 RepID=A0A0L0RX51_ALLM3|nr:hypothetical protein AMAG_00674 [Allomyces macrogynus ATCC 38327]|eukprot:KNE54715.1 hypothetical protein AMAG_00674 [Allomyces macrogynus ATCC 38327]